MFWDFQSVQEKSWQTETVGDDRILNVFSDASGHITPQALTAISAPSTGIKDREMVTAIAKVLLLEGTMFLIGKL